eukprot:scaffold2244_cov363-Pavlova_lutheri.AAC.26
MWHAQVCIVSKLAAGCDICYFDNQLSIVFTSEKLLKSTRQSRMATGNSSSKSRTTNPSILARLTNIAPHMTTLALRLSIRKAPSSTSPPTLSKKTSTPLGQASAMSCIRCFPPSLL